MIGDYKPRSYTVRTSGPLPGLEFTTTDFLLARQRATYWARGCMGYPVYISHGQTRLRVVALHDISYHWSVW